MFLLFIDNINIYIYILYLMEDTFITKKLKYNTLKKTIKNDNSMLNYGTIDIIHNKFMSEFDKQKKSIPKYQNKINMLKNELQNLNDKPLIKYTILEINRKAEIIETIENIEEIIEKINSNNDEMDYFAVNIDNLTNYYNNKNSYQTTDFNVTNANNANNENQSESTTLLSLFDGTSKKKISKSSEVYEDYLKCTVNKPNKKQNTMSQICEDCGVEKILQSTDGYMVCLECGHSDQIIVDMEKINFKDPFYENKSTKYKRMNHFSELMNQFQAKESTEIPPKIINMIIGEIKKQKITNPNKLKKNKMRSILKKLELNQYFEHVPFIINKLTGLPSPTITREIEEKLKSMFKEIQNPFEIFKPKNRKNFLNYNYVYYKFFELLELDHFLPHFTLLKSATKLREQDEIWEKICKYLKWQYISSI